MIAQCKKQYYFTNRVGRQDDNAMLNQIGSLVTTVYYI
jgi:hypothetical protein